MSFPFKIPFAASGDQSTVPDSDLTGSVNFTDGYTPDYQADPSLDPNAKLIERDKFNFLMNKITGAVGEIQRQGAADWYADLAPYDLNAEVFYNGKRWRSTIANNSAVPESGPEWLDVTPGTAAARDAIGVGDLYSRGGILGTVSQSGGVPTGAIIQRGSNANGEFVKYADGTMVCTGTVTSNAGSPITEGALFLSTTNFSPTYAASFSSVDSVHVSTGRPDNSSFGYAALPIFLDSELGSLSNSSFPVFKVASTRTWSSILVKALYTAIGRWY